MERKLTIEKLKKLSTSENDYVFPWAEARRRFNIETANSFFIFVLLDQGQSAGAAESKAKYFVKNFPSNAGNTFWEKIRKTHHKTLESYCKKGYDERSFAGRFQHNNLDSWIKDNARLMEHYKDDPRKIWNVPAKDVEKIYDRLINFSGIGDALAKMAQFILVRDYGLAGGRESRQFLKAKPDIHVRKVVARLGLSQSERKADVIQAIDNLGIDSQADLDAVLFNVGRRHCFPSSPDCENCPLNKVCQTSHTLNGNVIKKENNNSEIDFRTISLCWQSTDQSTGETFCGIGLLDEDSFERTNAGLRFSMTHYTKLEGPIDHVSEFCLVGSYPDYSFKEIVKDTSAEDNDNVFYKLELFENSNGVVLRYEGGDEFYHFHILK